MKRVRLSNIASVNMGQSPLSTSLNDRGLGLPFLQGSAEFGDEYPTNRLFCELPSKICSTGDVLISVRAPVGDTNKADQTYCIGRGLAAIKFKLVLPQYGWHSLNHRVHLLRRVSQGSTFEAVNQHELNALELLIPEVEDEQALIAAILDTVDDAIRYTEQMIAKLKQIRAGLLHDLLTYGIDENGELRDPVRHPKQFRESAIGLIPRTWDLTRLRELGDWMSGGTPSRNVPTYWGGDVPWASPKDMKSFYLEDTIEHLTEAGIVSGLRLVPKNTVFIVVRGMILAHSFPVGVVARPMAFNQDIKALVTNNKTSARYVAYWLVANAYKMLALTTSSTHGTKRLEFSEVVAQLMGFPSLHEQDRITDILVLHDREITIMESQRDKLIATKMGLMDDLLTGRVRVVDLLSAEE